MKELLNSMGWVSKSLVLALSFSLFPLLITGLYQKGVKPEVTITWWSLGVFFGMISLAVCGGQGLITGNHRDFFITPQTIAILIIMGATIGVVMQTFYGQAIQTAPNPALAIAVINSSVILSYVLPIVFHKTFPRSFPEVTVNTTSVSGIIFIVIGVFLVAKGK